MDIQQKMMKSLRQPTASRFTRSVLHRKGTTKKRATAWVDKQFGRRRRSHSSTHMGLIGLGAAALALPIGLLVGRRLDRNRHELLDPMN